MGKFALRVWCGVIFGLCVGMSAQADAQLPEIRVPLLTGAERTFAFERNAHEGSGPGAMALLQAMEGRHAFVRSAAHLAVTTGEEAGANRRAERRLRFARWGIVFGSAITAAGVTYAAIIPFAPDDSRSLRIGSVIASVGIVALVSSLIVNARTTHARRTPRWKLALMGLAATALGGTFYWLTTVADSDHFKSFISS